MSEFKEVKFVQTDDIISLEDAKEMIVVLREVLGKTDKELRKDLGIKNEQERLKMSHVIELVVKYKLKHIFRFEYEVIKKDIAAAVIEDGIGDVRQSLIENDRGEPVEIKEVAPIVETPPARRFQSVKNQPSSEGSKSGIDDDDIFS